MKPKWNSYQFAVALLAAVAVATVSIVLFGLVLTALSSSVKFGNK